MVHVQQNILRHRPMVNLINKLGDLPISKKCDFDRFFFWNSGSEAGVQSKIYIYIIESDTCVCSRGGCEVG
jgi:adenosylmethionine-8-amino-7-oxononanoate aminotransferase